jgi:hypothetical protein
MSAAASSPRRCGRPGETLEYISPPFSKIQPKNSPLWKTKPDLQLYYNTSRDFCRAYFPDVLLGVYSQEELRDHVGPDNAKDVNERPSVGQRLKAKGNRGFNASHVERETRGGVVDATRTPPSAIYGRSCDERSSNVDLRIFAVAATGLSPPSIYLLVGILMALHLMLPLTKRKAEEGDAFTNYLGNVLAYGLCWPALVLLSGWIWRWLQWGVA